MRDILSPTKQQAPMVRTMAWSECRVPCRVGHLPGSDRSSEPCVYRYDGLHTHRSLHFWANIFWCVVHGTTLETNKRIDHWHADMKYSCYPSSTRRLRLTFEDQNIVTPELGQYATV